MRSRRRFYLQVIVSLVVVLAISTSVYAASFSRVAGSTWSSGGGVSPAWGGTASDGTIKTKVEVSHSMINFQISIGKSQVIACKNVTPSFSGTGKIKTTIVLNGELKSESKSLKIPLIGTIPGGQANADVQMLIQVAKSKVFNKGLMFVGSQFWLPHSYSFNNATQTYEVTYPVVKGQQIEICGGLMTNASVLWGGGSASSYFFSSRYARTYVVDVTLSK